MLLRTPARTLLWIPLHHPAFNFEQESHDHLAVFFRNFHELDADDGPVLPLYDGIDHRHAFVLQHKDCGSDHLTDIKEVVELRRYQPGAATTQFINDRIDVFPFHAQEQVNGLIRDHRYPEGRPLFRIVGRRWLCRRLYCATHITFQSAELPKSLPFFRFLARYTANFMAKATILIVDKEKILIDLLVRTLSTSDVSVLGATSADEGARLVDTQRPYLLVIEPGVENA